MMQDLTIDARRFAFSLSIACSHADIGLHLSRPLDLMMLNDDMASFHLPSRYRS